MTGIFLVISLFWLLPVLCHSLDVPLQSALLIRGEPVGFMTPAHRHKRSETAGTKCRDDEYPAPITKHCCNKCLEGYRVASHCSGEGMKSNCTPCLDGTVNKKASGSEKCKSCSQCLSGHGQIELRPCTTKNDTVCGCPTGHYKYINTVTGKFKCLQCKTCENGSVYHSCTEDRDTLCTCHHEFYRDHATGNCRPCNECNEMDDCKLQCPPTSKQPKEATGSITTVMAATPTTAPSDEDTSLPPIRITLKPKPSLFAVQLEESDVVPMILAAVLGAALLVVLVVIVVKHRHKLRQILSAVNTNGPLPATDLSGSSQLDKPLIDSSKTPFKLDSLPGNTVCVVEDPVLQQQNAAQNVTLPLPDITLQTQATFLNSPEILYKVIECIPVGRWTELIRRLGVSNHVIDTSEHDYRPYKEAQYAMLSHWVHNAGSSGAARDMLFRVLREMNLGGCIEKIEESL